MCKKMTYTIITISLLVAVMAFSGCARINTINFTDTGAIAKTRGEVEWELELLPDGTKKVKFSSKKGKSRFEKIAEYIRPDNITIGGK